MLLENIKKRFYSLDLSDNTKRTYYYSAKKYVDYLSKKHNIKNPKNVSSKLVNAYIKEEVNNDNISTASKRGRVRMLKHLYDILGVKIKFEKYSFPDQYVDLNVRIESHDYIMKYASAFKEEKHRIIFLLLYSTGIQQKELCELKIKHIDSGCKKIIIGEKTYIIPRSLRSDIKKYISKRDSDEYIFITRLGSYYSPRTIEHTIRMPHQTKVMKRYLTSYILRSSCIVRLLKLGVSETNIEKKLCLSRSVIVRKLSDTYIKYKDVDVI